MKMLFWTESLLKAADFLCGVTSMWRLHILVVTCVFRQKSHFALTTTLPFFRIIFHVLQ